MIQILFVLIELIILFSILYIIWLMLYSMFFGAPYAALGKGRLKTMLQLAAVKKGERVADLGAGDGRIVIAFAKAGVIAHGYEINPLLYFLAKRNIQKVKTKGKAEVFLKDLWTVNLSSYDVITLYGNFPMMARLEKKLKKELPVGARVISNHFLFPHWKAEKVFDDTYLFRK